MAVTSGGGRMVLIHLILRPCAMSVSRLRQIDGFAVWGLVLRDGLRSTISAWAAEALILQVAICEGDDIALGAVSKRPGVAGNACPLMKQTMRAVPAGVRSDNRPRM